MMAAISSPVKCEYCGCIQDLGNGGCSHCGAPLPWLPPSSDPFPTCAFCSTETVSWPMPPPGGYLVYRVP